MNLHEHQAKELLQRYGVPLAKGITVYKYGDVDAALTKLPGPVWVVKSQIHAGGRGKGYFSGHKPGSAGGIRLSFSTDEVKANVREMLGATLITKQTGPTGQKVNRIYIENGADIDTEFYVSILVNREKGKRAFVLSTAGGMDIEAVAQQTPESIHTVEIPGRSLDQPTTARLLAALRLTGDTAEQAIAVFKSMYCAFIENDLSLLEVNPLARLKNGSLQLLDAKISIDQNALFRQPRLAALRDWDEEDEKETEATNHGLSYIALDGSIGCMVNGAGLAMATMDIIKLYGAEPANFLDVGGSATVAKVTAAFKIITEDPTVTGILVNIFGGIMQCDVIARGIVLAVREIGLSVPLVIRLEGTNVQEGTKILAESGISAISAADLDDAARKIISAVKGYNSGNPN